MIALIAAGWGGVLAGFMMRGLFDCRHLDRVHALEQRLRVVIYDATAGALSNPDHDLEELRAAINAAFEREWKSGLDAGSRSSVA